jgi:hypothetical protein
MRFLSRGRAFTERENQLLTRVKPLTGTDFATGERPPRTGTHIVGEAGLNTTDACSIPGRASNG